MNRELRKSVAAWVEGGRKVGFVILLVAGSAALGFLIAWPLWLFATSARSLYTVTVLGLAGAGIVFLVVRAARRRRKAVRDAGRPPLSVLFGSLAVVVGVSGAYLAAALIVRRLWTVAAVVVVLSAALLWLLGRARGAAKAQKVRPIPAENGTK